jgi:hypothetical protein
MWHLNKFLGAGVGLLPQGDYSSHEILAIDCILQKITYFR